MPSYIIKIKDRYFEWSTIVDAPTTYALTLDELKEHIKERYGQVGLDAISERLERVEEKGTSSLHNDLAETISCNRAGKGEKHLTADQIYARYQTPETETEAEPEPNEVRCLDECRHYGGSTEEARHAPGCPIAAKSEAEKAQEPRVARKEEERIYPCDHCDKMRTKDEGGTVFTLCEECLNKHFKSDPTPPTQEPRAARKNRLAIAVPDFTQAILASNPVAPTPTTQGGGEGIDWSMAQKWAEDPLPGKPTWSGRRDIEWQDHATENAARAYLALRAEIERIQGLVLSAGARENALRSDLLLANEQLAEKEREIAELRRLYKQRCDEADHAYVRPGGEPR